MVLKSGQNCPLGGDFDRQGSEKSKGGNRGAKQHQGARMLNH